MNSEWGHYVAVSRGVAGRIVNGGLLDFLDLLAVFIPFLLNDIAFLIPPGLEAVFLAVFAGDFNQKFTRKDIFVDDVDVIVVKQNWCRVNLFELLVVVGELGHGCSFQLRC